MNIQDLPENVGNAIQPLITRIPLENAMEQLVVTRGADAETIALVEQILADNAVFARYPALASGLWLYVDALDRSHRISQGIDDSTGSFWHGIMHRREGDFSNSHYWFRRAGLHPVMERIPDYDPHELIDAVAEGRSADRIVLRQQQREEWMHLFGWCAANANML